MAHNWQETDDIKVLYIVLYGYENIPYKKNDIAEQIGVTVGSLNYRLGNFKAIQGIGKVTHIAKLSKYVYDKYSSLSEQKLLELAFNVI
ncbi:MAG: hypothetical protein PHW89_03920 [Sulfurimonas denitrificans]|nr:hypothetical protein [Sulfurimonas denitrificans]